MMPVVKLHPGRPPEGISEGAATAASGIMQAHAKAIIPYARTFFCALFNIVLCIVRNFAYTSACFGSSRGEKCGLLFGNWNNKVPEAERIFSERMKHSASFNWQTTERPIVALAPMAGVTDASYRQIIKRLAPETIVYSEFLSTDAIHYGARKTMQMMHFDPDAERPFIVQIFGKEPENFLSAAKVIEDMGADGIDINMGCPAARVTSSCHGSALMRNPVLAAELVAATKQAVHIPVSVKTRLGWDSPEELIPFCQKLIEAGADALAIHGRTYRQKYSGTADWEPIYALKKEVSVPVIGNGDIFSAHDALEKIGNLDGVMIGRGTFGDPWLMKDVCDALRETKNEKLKMKNDFFTKERLSFQEKIPLILEHCALAVRLKGEKRGMLEMRKHLASYVKGFDGARDLRAKLVRVETFEDVQCILQEVPQS
ncbi:MAG: tRNA dihydrouridine synthase DusB [Candidatus Peribacteraceae bacterium]